MVYSVINTMEAAITSPQYFPIVLPVALVVLFAVLVFAFGFKSSVEPPSFKHISFTPDDKKNPKKKKVKDKKPQTNGHATVVIDVPEAKKESAKPAKQVKVETPKQKKNVDLEKVQEKKPEIQKSPSKKDKKSEGKAKKSAQNLNEKPADFDEGEWEVAPSRKDKKSKKKDDQEILPVYTPEKNSKKKPVIGGKKDEKLTILEAKPMEVLKLEDILPPSKVEVVEAIVATIEAPVAIPAPAPAAPALETAAEELVAKKKKVKKAKTSASEEDAVVPEVAAGIPPASEAAAATPQASEEAAKPAPEAVQVFNELEDTWKEAPQKKSKKKVRKD